MAVNPVEEADDEEKDAAAEHKYYVHSGHYWILKVIVFSPPLAEIYSAIKYLEHGGCRSISWPLCAVAIEARYLSLNCASCWQSV